MLTVAIRFVSLFLTALLAGTTFGIWLGFNPVALSAAAYVEMQQNAIRALNVPMPALGGTCIVLTAALAVRTRTDKRARGFWSSRSCAMWPLVSSRAWPINPSTPLS